MNNYLLHHQLAIGLGAFWLASNVATAMPSPSQSSSALYKFLFTLLHGLIGSLPRIFPGLRLPGDGSRSDQSFFGSPPPPPTA
jgi:hypothetical protein